MTRRVAGPALLAAAAACAQPGAPPGGEIDRLPPRVVAVEPAPFDTIRQLSKPVVIRFDERLSERLEGVRKLEDAVLVSPETGRVRVHRGRRSMEISLAGGWRPGLVYRVTVQPVFRDLFQNQREEPVELVFSTGAPFPETALAGFVEDRLTGEPAAGVRVEAMGRGDRMLYLAVTDSAGFFAMRYLPEEEYDVRAWLDQDRDRTPDFFEARDTAPALAVAVGDTQVVELGLLPGDTTAAQLARVEPVDPSTLTLFFDDYFAPGAVEGSGEVVRFGDSTLVSRGRLIHGSRLDSIQAAREAAADSAAADSAAAAAPAAPAEARPDSLPGRPAALGRPEARGRPGAAGAARPGARPGPAPRPLPSRELILLLPAPLMPDSTYYVVVEGVRNINGIPGGGGSARLEMPPPPPPDSLESPPDSGATAGGGPGAASAAPASRRPGR